jgi:hypothetical protein
VASRIVLAQPDRFFVEADYVHRNYAAILDELRSEENPPRTDPASGDDGSVEWAVRARRADPSSQNAVVLLARAFIHSRAGIDWTQGQVGVLGPVEGTPAGEVSFMVARTKPGRRTASVCTVAINNPPFDPTPPGSIVVFVRPNTAQDGDPELVPEVTRLVRGVMDDLGIQGPIFGDLS